MFRKKTCWIVLCYGFILLILGILGYVRKQSLVSLLLGGGLGLLVSLSALCLFAKKKAGIYMSVILTLLICVTFTIRYTTTHKPIPGVLSVLSGAMLLFLLVQSVKWKKKS